VPIVMHYCLFISQFVKN